MGMAVVCGTLVACDHRDRLDRLVLLLHRARSRAGEAAASARRCLWRGVAGAWRRLLPYPEVPGGAGTDARAPDLVQMGKLCDLAIGLPDAGNRLLRRRGPLPDRHPRHGAQPVAGDRHLGRLAGGRLGDLRPALQVAGRQKHLGPDGGPLRGSGRHGLGLYAGLHRPRRLPAPLPRRSCPPTSFSSSSRTRRSSSPT